MEYSVEDSFPERPHSVHHIVDDTSDGGVDDPPLDDEGPSVLTWFTFYSHRAQREYYYEPISGTTTWIAPTTTTLENDDCVVSRLPGSPMEAVQHVVQQGAQQYEQHVVPVITKRPVAWFLFWGNLVLLAALWWSFQGDFMERIVWIKQSTRGMALVSFSPQAVNVLPTHDALVDSLPNTPLDTANDPLDPTEEDASNDNDDVVTDVILPQDPAVPEDTAVVDVTQSDETPPTDPTEPMANDDEPFRVDTAIVVDDSEPAPPEEEMRFPSYSEEEVPVEDVVASSDVVVEILPVEDSRMAEDAASSPMEDAVVEDGILPPEAEEAPVVIPSEQEEEATLDGKKEEVPAALDGENEEMPATAPVEMKETLLRIQTAGDALVQRVALVALAAGYSIELEPNVTTATPLSPRHVLLHGVAA